MGQQQEASAHWRSSGRCGGNGTCVEVARLDGGAIGVRDSVLGASGPVLKFAPAEWRAFAARIKAAAEP
ncbi:DUF397 domain-containing protein [Actinomadura keratinilytica]|jgi:hypothetical protein|uniref:DUF397 domain-containing protein n=1 Tax=Actinomadura keratinilytica TaxID=547461 RepID=A0ABP7YPB5_9ACTN